MADTLTKRNYLPLATVQVQTAAADINDLDFAEQLIDNYVGYQNKHVAVEHRGQITALTGSDKIFADTSSNSQLNLTDNYFKNCVIEMVSGGQAGNVRAITSSDKDDKTVTIATAFDSAPAVGDYFKIYQLGKFPRHKDVGTDPSGTIILKSIPQAIKDAVLAQVAFQAQMGDAYFAGDDSDKESESIGNYSYSRGSAGATSSVKFVAPRARILLRGIKNLTGRLIA